MENLKSHSHTMDLFELYEKEFQVLSSDHNALQLENAEDKLYFKRKFASEKRKTRDLIQEIEEITKKLERANSLSGVKVISSSPRPDLDVEQFAEHQVLAAELEMEKRKSEALSQDVTELNLQLQTERDLRAEAEARAGEAVDIADQLMQELVEVRNGLQTPTPTPTPTPTAPTLDAQLQAKVEDLQLEIQELKQTLQKEKELRVQAEAEKVEAVKTAEAVKSCSDNALQSLGALEKTMEDAADRNLAEKKKNDDLQQEIAELLQKQSDMRERHEAASLRSFEALEALCQELVKVKRVSEDQSAERQSLTTGLETEEKKQKGLCHDVLQLIHVLEREMEARTRAEADK